MKKKYPVKDLAFISGLLLLFIVASCKKDNTTASKTQTTTVATPTTLGLYEADSAEYKQLIVGIEKVGTQTVNDYEVFDTGSGGMVLDAHGIIPASMITSTGFSFTGDTTNTTTGITITKDTLTLTYGANDSTLSKVYGNLAYATVTVGDANGTVSITRMPFFLYYKAVNNGHTLGVGEFDTFGVSQEYITFSDGKYITSPFNYFNPGTGLVKGFKLAALGTSNFSYDGTYVPGLVTLGLTSADLSSSSGFVFSQLHFYLNGGYLPILPATVTYNGTSFDPDGVLFDTGTAGYSYIEDPNISAFETLLPTGTPLSVATTSGFTWNFTTAKAEYLTYLENPAKSGAEFSVLSIESFITNEYMLDFTDHKLGLKNN